MLDTFVYKKLAHNDTGAAKGNQAGILIPKDIAAFFPPLHSEKNSNEPTVDQRLTAELFVDGHRVATVETRYQHQTWSGTRPPERRLTDNLGPLRNAAQKDDIVLFAKDLLDDGFIQIKLVRQGSNEYATLDSKTSGKPWGIIDEDNPPVSLQEITDAEEFVDEQSQHAASAFGTSRDQEVVKSVRKARDRAFRKKVLFQYDFRCAFTERRFASPVSAKTVGLDAAHIVPVSSNGSDHPANGLALSKDIHWSFDRGLIGVAHDRTIYVSKNVGDLAGNEYLKGLHGKPIRKTISPVFEALEESLTWHRANVLIK